MEWKVVELTKNSRGRNTPYASIGHGKIALSAAACDLIANFDEYKYVELCLPDSGNEVIVGVQFLKTSTPNSITIKRKEVNGKVIRGCEITNKSTIERLYGLKGTQKKTTRMSVTKATDKDNFLIIDEK